jgi:hypothetical protein
MRKFHVRYLFTLIVVMIAAEEWSADGHTGNITNIDYSPLVIKFMLGRHNRTKFPNVEYLEADVTQMSRVQSMQVLRLPLENSPKIRCLLRQRHFGCYFDSIECISSNFCNV